MTDIAIEQNIYNAKAITRPDRALMTYYVICSCFAFIGFPFVFLPLWIKYVTLEYKIDDDGVSMSWGFLFRKQILLTYRRIQDIHVKRNIIHRWLGLADVAIQTASGTSGAEMTIVGIRRPELLRDYLYSQMRGAKDDSAHPETPQHSAQDEALQLLTEIRDALRTKNADAGDAS